MNHNWQNMGYIAPGGAVFQIVGDGQDHLWLASPAGLFYFDGLAWHGVRRGIPFWRINTILAVGHNLWVAGMPGGILRSANGGKTWHRSWIEQTDAPVITLAASPNYRRDRVLLAGTDGDGILRSTDGGRYWEFSNFGLREFALLGLATAPVWDRYEYAFAITEGNIYQSPNGGRAWRRVEANIFPTSVAISPDFAIDQTLFVGDQDGKLLVSTDAGHTWQLAADGLGMINALAFSMSGSLLIGTTFGVYQVPTAKTAVYPIKGYEFVELPATVLTLNEATDTLYAGLVDGLHKSQDDGHSWQPVSSLSARHFIWYLAPQPDCWLAAGPEEAVWLSRDGGQQWHKIWEDEAVLAVAAGKKQLWISVPDGVITSTDHGKSWRESLTSGTPITAMALSDETLWAGGPAGAVWRAIDDEWQAVTAPFAGAQLLGLYAQGHVLLAAVWSAESGMIQLWRTENGGSDWQLWFNQSAHPITPHVAFTDESGETAVIGLGTDIFHLTETGWQRQKVTEKEAPITALLADQDKLLAACTDRLVSSVSGDEWETIAAMEGYPIVALKTIAAEAGPDQLFVGTADGRVFLTRAVEKD